MIDGRVDILIMECMRLPASVRVGTTKRTVVNAHVTLTRVLVACYSIISINTCGGTMRLVVRVRYFDRYRNPVALRVLHDW